jgi:hypothetical protein
MQAPAAATGGGAEVVPSDAVSADADLNALAEWVRSKGGAVRNIRIGETPRMNMNAIPAFFVLSFLSLFFFFCRLDLFLPLYFLLTSLNV